jgi:hypothetical protein
MTNFDFVVNYNLNEHFDETFWLMCCCVFHPGTQTQRQKEEPAQLEETSV